MGNTYAPETTQERQWEFDPKIGWKKKGEVSKTNLEGQDNKDNKDVDSIEDRKSGKGDLDQSQKDQEEKLPRDSVLEKKSSNCTITDSVFIKKIMNRKESDLSVNVNNASTKIPKNPKLTTQKPNTVKPEPKPRKTVKPEPKPRKSDKHTIRIVRPSFYQEAECLYEIGNLQEIEQEIMSKKIRYFNVDTNAWCSYEKKITDVEEYSKYGIGIYLFWKYFFGLVIIFLFMSLSAIFVMVLCILGDSLEPWEAKLFLERTTFANLGFDCVNYGKSCSSLQSYNAIINGLDIVYCLILFFYWVHIRCCLYSAITKARAKYPMPSYYAIRIKNLPENINEEYLSNHLGKFGDVVEVKFARNYNEVWPDLNRLADMKRKIIV